MIRKYQASIKRYNNGTFDRTAGPPDPTVFPMKEKDSRYKKFAALDRDGICMVRTSMGIVYKFTCISYAAIMKITYVVVLYIIVLYCIIAW